MAAPILRYQCRRRKLSVQAVFPPHLFSQALAPREVPALLLALLLVPLLVPLLVLLVSASLSLQLCLPRKTRKSVLNQDCQLRTLNTSRLESLQSPRQGQDLSALPYA